MCCYESTITTNSQGNLCSACNLAYLCSFPYQLLDWGHAPSKRLKYKHCGIRFWTIVLHLKFRYSKVQIRPLMIEHGYPLRNLFKNFEAILSEAMSANYLRLVT